MRRLPLLPPLLFLLSLLQAPTFAAQKSYIVYLGAHTHGLDPTSADLERATNSHYDLLGSLLGSPELAEDKIFYSYTRNINGFAAFLEDEEAAAISKHSEVVSVFLNKGRQLHTTRSWEFLNLERKGEALPGSIWDKARFGEDTIIANLDTGVWPESKSFSDEGMGPIPKRWRGTCQSNGVTCNRKLIGARYFNKGYAAYAGPLNESFSTARDHEGHGSHTLSTAGGSFVPGASVLGYGNGTAKGGSPSARVAAYKVCWPPVSGHQCFDADIMAAFDAAISDGVDVLSVSLGGVNSDFFEDGISIGTFHAVRRGIVVVCSAGNSGPSPGTVANVSPWMLTVGASTMDREFANYVQLGNNKSFKGQSLSEKSLQAGKFYPLISAVDAKLDSAINEEAVLCKPGTLDPEKVKGKIVVCVRGGGPRTNKGVQALEAGAVGMVLANDKQSANEIIADPHLLPATHINFTDGESVLAYINTTKNPSAYITPVKTVLGVKPAPCMAAFSSRGPNLIEPTILKPDITAPGVSIIAAFSEAVGPTDEATDKRQIPFASQSGTSMSCPHVSGIVGLLKSLYPHWSPAAIKSAIMTTARVRDNRKEALLDSFNKEATPFAYGAGHVRSNRAMDPGLIYDLTTHDYLNFLCARGYNASLIELFSEKPYSCPKSASLLDFNYPSISVYGLNGSVVAVSRRVKSVGGPGTYKVRVVSPAGVSVRVKPSTLVFVKSGEEKRFVVSLKAKENVKSSEFVFGRLIWSDGRHCVTSPLVVKHSSN